MSISEFVTTTAPQPKRLVLSGTVPPDSVVEAIRDFLDVPPHGLTYAAEHPATPLNRSRKELRPDDSLVSVYDGSERLLTVGVEQLRAAATSEAEVLNTTDEECDPTALIERLGTNAFVAKSNAEMTVLSRLIERKAHDCGRGELHACFQRLSRLGEDLGTLTQYNLLANAGIAVHVYGLADHPLRHLDGVTVHGGSSAELESSWTVAYAEDPRRKDAEAGLLIAQERGSEEYAGYWTFDPTVTADVIGYLNDSY